MFVRWGVEGRAGSRSAFECRKRRVDGVVVQLAMLDDGSCIVGGLIPPYARYELQLENERGERMTVKTAIDGTFCVVDPPQGRLRIHIDADRRSGFIER